jgi:hypothetical protein
VRLACVAVERRRPERDRERDDVDVGAEVDGRVLIRGEVELWIAELSWTTTMYAPGGMIETFAPVALQVCEGRVAACA